MAVECAGLPAACWRLPQIIPLLTELRAGNLVGNVEALTQVRAGRGQQRCALRCG